MKLQFWHWGKTEQLKEHEMEKRYSSPERMCFYAYRRKDGKLHYPYNNPGIEEYCVNYDGGRGMAVIGNDFEGALCMASMAESPGIEVWEALAWGAVSLENDTDKRFDKDDFLCFAIKPIRKLSYLKTHNAERAEALNTWAGLH